MCTSHAMCGLMKNFACFPRTAHLTKHVSRSAIKVYACLASPDASPDCTTGVVQMRQVIGPRLGCANSRIRHVPKSISPDRTNDAIRMHGVKALNSIHETCVKQRWPITLRLMYSQLHLWDSNRRVKGSACLSLWRHVHSASSPMLGPASQINVAKVGAYIT